MDNISDFKSNFAKVYHSQVLPSLYDFDNERKEARVSAILITVLITCSAGIAGFCGYIYNIELLLIISILVGLIGCLIYPSVQKVFKDKLKARIMPSLMKAFGNFTWTVSQVIDTQEIKDLKNY